MVGERSTGREVCYADPRDEIPSFSTRMVIHGFFSRKRRLDGTTPAYGNTAVSLDSSVVEPACASDMPNSMIRRTSCVPREEGNGEEPV